jgi:hypothetical protein
MENRKILKLTHSKHFSSYLIRVMVQHTRGEASGKKRGGRVGYAGGTLLQVAMPDEVVQHRPAAGKYFVEEECFDRACELSV